MDFAKKISQESVKWVERGIISKEQQEQILSLYPEKSYSLKNSSFILKSVSALFVGIAFFLIISANWKYLPPWLRSSMVLLPLIFSHLALVYFWKKEDKTHVNISAFLASLLLGANIFLQAQIFHMVNPYSEALLAWMVGILPTFFWLKAKPIGYLYLFLQVLHIFLANLVGKFNYLWLFLFLPNLWIYQKEPSRPFFYFLLFSSLINFAIFLTQQDGSPYFFSLALGLWGYSFTVILAKDVLKRVRLAFLWYLFFVVYILTFTDLSSILLLSSLNWQLVFGIIFSHALVFFSSTFILEKTFLGVFTLILISLKAIFPQENSENGPLIISWVLNIALLLTSLYLLYLGFKEQKKGLFFTGLSYLLLLAFGRYLSLVKDYLTTAILFFLSALLLWYLNQRWEKLYAKR